MSDLFITMQSCLTVVKNLNFHGMNLYPALRAVRWQTEKHNTESFCASPAPWEGSISMTDQHTGSYNGFFLLSS